MIAAVNSDSFTFRYKGRHPVLPTRERMEIVAACRYVDDVVANNTETLRPLIERFRPDFIVQAGWPCEDYLKQIGCDELYLEQMETEVISLPYTDFVSTTSLIETIKGRT